MKTPLPGAGSVGDKSFAPRRSAGQVPGKADEAAALRLVVEGTVSETGGAFFRALVRNLARALGTTGAWVTEWFPEPRRLRALAMWLDGKHVDHFEYPVAGTPCEAVVEKRGLVHIPERLLKLYPADAEYAPAGAASYLGVPLLDTEGRVMGHLAVLDTKPMPADPRMISLFEIFAARAAAEHRRLKVEQEVQECEDRIQLLIQEADYLREAVREVPGYGELLGRSDAMCSVFEAIRKVARTNATVLITGETGTGKELVARAIHRASDRADKPLVLVNCAAIPANLIESEFFGHERGAFTGALTRREGRFSLANKGTIFLDEIGELPLELQAKLLRVLQEGEFAPLGAARTLKVDVRVLAATNRDLKQMAAEGKFREDLYFRLHVFPIHIPPLRERGRDIEHLAAAFTQRFSRRIGKRIGALTAEQLQALRAYDWPGNIRELQNVVERAIILASGAELPLARAMSGCRAPDAPQAASHTQSPDRVLTAREMEALEAGNIRKALAACGGRVSGENGAARLLGIPPTTLGSRMKALGLHRPKA
jgi:transcriptional regulator with GAF, ATPase, and Fis domain